MKIGATAIQTALSWGIVAFTIATIVLAIQNAKINADLKDTKQKLDYLESQLEGEVHPRSVRAVSNDDTKEIDYRLPLTLGPTHYNLYLHPDIENEVFTGQEVIDVTIYEDTKRIILHSLKLNIQDVNVTTFENTLNIENYYLESKGEFLIIDMTETLLHGTEIKIGIVFSGEMKNKIVGLYSSTYLTETEQRRAIATSKFEPTYARQAFPCFDEPAMKATFEIVLVHPTEDGYHSLSNMNEKESVAMGKYTETYFAKSVAMSTYLACFIVSDFAHKTEQIDAKGIGDNFDLRIFATAHQLNKVDFAVKTAVAVTEFYINYFKVPYPLPKLDMAAIPDFGSNAMEHWGLVTYRETALLYDITYSSTWNKQRIAVVVAHELAHMWFGNLVTMMWWNDLWLNEGFARYMEYKGVNAVYPHWGMLNQFLVHALHNVMDYDSSLASHPIRQTVDTPDQITEIFDTISYDKGASVIRMLEDVTGEKFEEAVTSYLTHFQFKNAITDDFIKELEDQKLDFDVKLFMRTWTEQMGLPVVEVTRTTPTTFRLTQKRFFSNIEDYNAILNDSVFNYTWSIPLTYYTDLDKDTIARKWFNYDESSVEISVDPETKWIKVNVNQMGYYRVNYAENTWHEIIERLIATPEEFSVADRAHLLNDIFALADAKQLRYDFALDMTKYLEKENDFVPWYVASTKLKDLQINLRYTDAYIDYLAYVHNLLTKIYAQFTWEVKEEDHLNNRLRVTVLSTACVVGIPECLNEAATRFTNWLTKPEDKPAPDLREIVYRYGMKEIGKQEHWDKMWQIYLKEQDASEKAKLMIGLSAVRIPWLLYNFIELAEHEEYVRRQDYFTCLENIAKNPIGTHVVWDYVRENWSKLVNRFGLNDRHLGRMIPSITQTFNTEIKLEELSEFFNKYPEAGAGAAARKQALETVKYNIKWLAENKDNVATWLNAQR